MNIFPTLIPLELYHIIKKIQDSKEVKNGLKKVKAVWDGMKKKGQSGK